MQPPNLSHGDSQVVRREAQSQGKAAQKETAWKGNPGNIAEIPAWPVPTQSLPATFLTWGCLCSLPLPPKHVTLENSFCFIFLTTHFLGRGIKYWIYKGLEHELSFMYVLQGEISCWILKRSGLELRRKSEIELLKVWVEIEAFKSEVTQGESRILRFASCQIYKLPESWSEPFTTVHSSNPH